MGSLLAATASWLDARSREQRWLVRIDDIDPPRTVPGAESAILAALEHHALRWDGAIDRQSDHLDLYSEALEGLESAGAVFYCTCSRRALAGKRVYPGRCRPQTAPLDDAAIRVKVGSAEVDFLDRIAGAQHERLSETCGDFIVRRRDGLIAYQLATAVDDGDPAITDVVRGGDLLRVTARQIFLMTLLGLSVPDYAHLPTLLDGDGNKLSKQHHAPPLDNAAAAENLHSVLRMLGLEPPSTAERWQPAELLDWALPNWSVAGVPGKAGTFRHQGSILLTSPPT